MSKKSKGMIAVLCVAVILLAGGYKAFTMYRNVHAKLNDILFVVDKNTKAITDVAAVLKENGIALEELTTIANENAAILEKLNQ